MSGYPIESSQYGRLESGPRFHHQLEAHRIVTCRWSIATQVTGTWFIAYCAHEGHVS